MEFEQRMQGLKPKEAAAGVDVDETTIGKMQETQQKMVQQAEIMRETNKSMAEAVQAQTTTTTTSTKENAASLVSMRAEPDGSVTWTFQNPTTFA